MRMDLRRTWSRISASRRGATVCAIFYLAFFGFYLAERPNYNWDMLAYMAVALRMEGASTVRAHDETYDIIRSSVPRAWVDDLTGNFDPDAVAVGLGTTRMSDRNLRRDWAAHSDSFATQLPFYSVKPLYPALMALGNSLGLPLIQSGLIVSLRDEYAHLIAIATISGVARMIVLPTEPFRGLLPTYMFLTIALVNACCASFTPQAGASVIPKE